MAKPVYLIVTPFFPTPSNWRGAYCYDFAKALMREGRYDVRIFVPGADGEYEYQGVHVVTFRTKQLPSSVFPFLMARWNRMSFLNALARSCIEPSDVTICHGHTATFSIYPLAVKACNPSCMTLLHHHDPQSFGLNTGVFRHFWPYNVIQFPILRHYFEQIDCHVFISEMVRRSFIAVPDASWTQYQGYRKQMRGLGFYAPVRMKRGIVLHNGVDVARFNVNGVKRLHDGETFTIGCIGNFSDWKAQITLLKALDILTHRMNRKIRVRFIGSGPLLGECRKYASAHNLVTEASFEPEMDHSLLPDFYRSLDLFVLPSYFEGFGCVFTEAWACGVPFITCEGQGMDDLIPADERHLWLVRQQDPDDLAGKIREYMDVRPVQHLSVEVDIDRLVPAFLGKLCV